MNSDSFAVKIAVSVLAIIAVGASATIWWLAAHRHPIAEELVVSAGAAVTGLLGMLAATRTGTQPVQVQNSPADPVNVEEVAPEPPPARPLRRG